MIERKLDNKNVQASFEFGVSCINSALTRLEQQAEAGEIEAVRVYMALKKIANRVDAALYNLKSAVVEESSRYSSKEDFEFDGHLVKVESRRAWSYKHIPAWRAQKDYIAELVETPTKQLKKIEDIAKLAYQNGSAVVIDETGEVVEPANCTSNYVITIKEAKNEQ